MEKQTDLLLGFIRVRQYYLAHMSGKRPYDKYALGIDVRGKKYRTPYKELCHSRKKKPFDRWWKWNPDFIPWTI